MNDELTLRPCPFCGNEAPELQDHRLMWCVSCACTATVLGNHATESDVHRPGLFWHDIRQSAVDAWNKRAPLLPDKEDMETDK